MQACSDDSNSNDENENGNETEKEKIRRLSTRVLGFYLYSMGGWKQTINEFIIKCNGEFVKTTRLSGYKVKINININMAYGNTNDKSIGRIWNEILYV